MKLLRTLGGAATLTTLALFVIGQGSPAPMPLPQPRPLSAPPPDTTIDPVETVSFVQTIVSTPAATPAAATESTLTSATPAAVEISPRLNRERGRKSYAYDICRGKGRYYTHGGRSWRCRR
jgi:hypothetical protein